MNANTFTQMAYENISNWTLGENKPNFFKGQNENKPRLPAPGKQTQLLKGQNQYYRQHEQTLPRLLGQRWLSGWRLRWVRPFDYDKWPPNMI